MTPDVIRLEKAARDLSTEEKLWLVEQIVHRLRDKAPAIQPTGDRSSSLELKASDSREALRQLRQISHKMPPTDGVQLAREIREELDQRGVL